MKPGESDEQKIELIEKLQAYEPESEVMTLEEARDLVQRSGMLLVTGWDLEQIFMLDQIRRQDNVISYEAIGVDGLKRGTSFNIDTKFLVVWSMAPTSNKPKLMDVQSTKQCNMILRTLQDTFDTNNSKVLKHFSFMNEAKVEEMETRLAKSTHDYIDMRKLYEDDLRSSHVYKERIVELQAKVKELEDEVASLREKLT